MRLSHFLQVISAGLAFALLLVSPADATLEGAPPTAVVRATLDAVFHILDDQQLKGPGPVSYTHLRAHETVLDLVCSLLLEKKQDHNIRRAVKADTRF